MVACSSTTYFTAKAKCRGCSNNGDGRRDHLSVIDGGTPRGKVYALVRPRSLNGLNTIEFLLHLGRLVGDRLLVVWDGLPIHR